MNNPFDLFQVGDLVALPRTRKHTAMGKEQNVVVYGTVLTAPKCSINSNPNNKRRAYYQAKSSSWEVQIMIADQGEITMQTRFLKKVK